MKKAKRVGEAQQMKRQHTSKNNENSNDNNKYE